MTEINKNLLNTLYLPIIIADSEYNFLFSNSAFERFSKQLNIDSEPFITFTKANLNKFNRFTKPFEIPGKRIFIHSKKVDDLIIIHIEIIRQSLINSLRKEIINQFSASLSHIFYNLITIIKNNLEKEKEICHNKTINESVNRIQNIVDTVNLYSSNISGYIHTEEYNLNKLLDEAIKRNQPIWDFQAKLKKIEFIIVKKFEKEYTLKGSSDDMLLALIHIIKNSLEAMIKGGTITIETKETRNAFVDIVISDTGIGIDWQSKERVFEPFFTTKKLKRKGLGLSFTYGIVRKHRGSITFESQENIGTQVIISVPYQAKSLTDTNQTVVVTSEEDKKEKKIIPKKILLIDDEKMIVNTTAKILEKLSNAEVLKANSGNQAIAIFMQYFNEIDLIISDLGMDEVSGFDVAKFIQKFSAENNITPPRFILYTGWGNHVTEQELKENGIEAVYNKPLAAKDFKMILGL
jgi:signal transduction histidine kinase/ActR/RegA family two-component response regulator